MQLVVPEPRRMTPISVLDESLGTIKPVPDPGIKTPNLIPGLMAPYQHHTLPWQLPYFTGMPGYPYLRYPGLHAYAMSMLPDHLPWRYFPVEPKDQMYARLPIFPGLHEHGENGPHSPTDRSKVGRKLADDTKYDEYASREVKEMEGDMQLAPVFLSTHPTSPEKKKRKEPEQLKYVCSTCNKSYSTFSGLSKHKQFHCNLDGKKEFTCKYCDKTYVSLGALKMHIRTHTLPCKCKICGKAFSRPWLLQGHVRTHTGEKPFTCVHCLRAFADRSNLRAHLQTHSDVKKYSCKTCSKTFSRMSLLLKHEDSCARTEVI